MWTSSREIMDSEAFPMEALIDTPGLLPERQRGIRLQDCRTWNRSPGSLQQFREGQTYKRCDVNTRVPRHQYANPSSSAVGTIATDYALHRIGMATGTKVGCFTNRTEQKLNRKPQQIKTRQA